MRHGNSSSSSNEEIWRWNSPLPYLFGGLGLVLGLIVVALIILLCSHKKRTPPDHDKDRPPKNACSEPDAGQLIIVIMTGDENPTYLGCPVPALKDK